MNEQAGPGWPAGTRLLRVADVIVDLECRELERDAGTVELQQRVFDLLLVLLREPDVLHTRAALLERVWPGVVVEDANLSQAVWLLRGALGEERRHWIRTIPKRGYLFEPPVPPRAVDEPAKRPGAALERTTGRAPRRWLLGVASCLLAGAVLVLGMRSLPPRAALLDEGPVTVALLQVEGEEAASRWPALLLQAWLEWKLSTLPEVEVVDGTWLAADAAVRAPHVVLLSSGVGVADEGQHYVRVRLDTRDGPRQLEVRGNEAELPQLVDALSRQVLGLLLPARSADPWPSLAISPAAARAYVDAWQAYVARDMATAVVALEAVLKQAPDFGLAELQLGLSRARLGEAKLAREHMARARRSLRPLGMDSERLMSVRELSIDPRRHAEAAGAIGTLASEYPGRLSLRLEQADYLARAGRPDAAEAALGAVDWTRQPRELRIRWQTVTARVASARSQREGAGWLSCPGGQLATTNQAGSADVPPSGVTTLLP